MIARFSPEHRGRLVLLIFTVVALAGGITWILLDPPWSEPAPVKVSPAMPTGTALTVNGEPIRYEDLAVAARRAETSALETGKVSATFAQGANGAYVRLVLARESITSLARQILVVREAQARGIVVAERKLDEETRSAMAVLAEKSKASGSDITSLLLEVGQSLDEFTADMREETRLRLLSEDVAVAVIGAIKPSDTELRALYETDKPKYGDDFDKAKDRVRSDYNRAEATRRRDEWLATQVTQARVEIADPILAAFDRVKKGDQAGLGELERLWREKKVFDPYLAYYIARIYNDLASATFAERQDLEKGLGQTPTADQAAAIEAARLREKDANAKAISYYVATLLTASPDSDLLRRILQLNPPVAVRTLAMGLTSLLNGDTAGATTQLQEAIRLDAGLAAARLALGDLANRKGDPAAALSLYREASSRAPQDADVLLSASDECLAIGEFDEAEALVKKVRSVAPEYARLSIAEGDLALRRLYDAAAERDRLAAQATRTPAEEARRATLEKTILQTYQSIRTAYDKALARAESESVLLKIGNAELLAGKLDEAQDAFREVLRRSTHYPEAHVGLGDVLLKRGDTKLALAHYQAALGRIVETSQQIGVLARIVNIDPTSGPARIAYGIALTRLSRWNEAIAEFSKILEAQPDLVQAHLWIAESYTALGEYETSVAHLKWGLGGTATPAAKDSASAQIVSTLKKQLDSGGTPTDDSLDVLLEAARSRLGSGYPADAVDALGLLAAINPDYRKSEVLRLLEAAKTAPTKQQGTMD